MQYQSMYKRFFTHSKQIEEIYQNAFKSESAIHFDFNINQFPAYLLINSEITTMIEEIYELNAKIIEQTKGNRNLPLIALNWLVNYSLIEEIKITNEIEGISSTRKELKELFKIEQPTKYLRLYGMVNKYRKLLIDGPSIIYSNEDVRKLYEQILIQDIEREDINNLPDGVIYRKNAVDIVKGANTIHHGIMPEEKIIQMMSIALNILNNSSLNLLIRVAVFHYLFGYIHPFYEGNGRMARFISSNYLAQKLDVLSALQLATSCKQNQKLYYESFDITNDSRNKGDLTYFVIAFLEILKLSLQELLIQINNKTEQYLYYCTCTDELIKDHKQNLFIKLLLQATLFDSEGLSIKDISSVTELSPTTISKYLKLPVLKDIIIKDITNKPFLYRINLEQLSILH